MEKPIRNAIVNFQKAIAKRDIEKLKMHLHPDFRVMANRFKGGDGTLVLSKEVYLNMMKEEKIGGTSYDIEIINISVFDHTAMTEINFTSKEHPDMHLFLLLVQDGRNEWQIISDLPIVKARQSAKK